MEQRLMEYQEEIRLANDALVSSIQLLVVIFSFGSYINCSII